MEFLYSIGELHLPILIITILCILYADHQGLQYFLGKRKTLSPRMVWWSHSIIWCGLVGMIMTGAILLIPLWDIMVQKPEFLIKMGFVGVLVVNAYAIGTLSKVASEKPFAELSVREQRILMFSGFLSVSGWIGSTIIGFFYL